MNDTCRIKLLVSGLFLGLITIFIVACLSEAQQRSNAGWELTEEGRWEEAIAEYDEAIRLDPQDADAYHNRGFAYANLGEHQRAIEDLNEAIRLDPQLAQAYTNRGATYAALGEHQRAIEDLNEAIRLDPQLAQAYTNRGAAYDSLGQHQRAIEDFDEAIRLNPQLAQAYYDRGISYAALGEHPRAIKDFDEALRLNPQYAKAYNNRGIAYANLGEPQRAIEDFDEALRLNPQLAQAYNNRGLAYNKLGELQRAIKDFDEAIRLNPKRLQTYTDEQRLFSISYPQGWVPALSMLAELEEITKELVKSVESDLPLEKTSLMFFAGIPSEEGFNPSFNIVVESSDVSSLDETAEMGIRAVKSASSNYKSFTKANAVVGGREAIIFDHEYTMRSVPRIRPVQMFILDGKLAWTVSCGTSPERFLHVEETCNQIVSSFRILR